MKYVIRDAVKKHIDGLTIDELDELIIQANNNREKFLAWSSWDIILYAEDRRKLLLNYERVCSDNIFCN